MSGFVGSRAKRRKRNFFLTLGVIFFVGICIYLFPSLDTNNNTLIPNDNIMPNPSEDSTSLVSNIEQLELTLFQKDQKIKFRDGQIKNLQNKLKNMKIDYQAVILELKSIKSLSKNEDLVSSNKSKLLEENLTKIYIENDKNTLIIKNLNKKIDDLNETLFLIDEESSNIILENQRLKKDSKIFFAKNIKLENIITDLKNKINEQKIQIESHLEQLNNLKKDRSHHGS